MDLKNIKTKNTNVINLTKGFSSVSRGSSRGQNKLGDSKMLMQQHLKSMMAKKKGPDEAASPMQRMFLKSPMSTTSQSYDKGSSFFGSAQNQMERPPSYESKLISPLMKRKKKDLQRARHIQ